MTFSRDHIAFFIGFVILGGILGIAVGSFMVKLAPSLSIITAPLTKPIGFDGELISVYIRLNIAAVAGMIAGIVLFRWI
ncbi:MAG TPA: hypothetical protein PLV62_06550 [Spirochaetota bacterium]|nr:hypothetical protein [Spirochaetota bacterium]HRR61808.1 hypothetical protein [Spirochaetota bacterium]